MEPLAALGIAGNVVQLLDFGLNLLDKTKDIYASIDGIEVRNIELEQIAQSLIELNRRLRTRSNWTCAHAITEDEIVLRSLIQNCNTIAEDLVGALEMAKVSGKFRTWKCVRQALKSVLGRDGIENLHLRMKEYREQIVIVLLTITSARQTDMDGRVKSVGESVVAAESRIVDETRRARTQILHAIRTKAFSPDDGYSVALLSQLLSQMNLEKSETINKQNVLHSLYFPRMLDRKDYICEAHYKTFHWILQANKSTTAVQPYHNFVDWLTHSDGIYWINGKPGSGKSTLMKYIEQDPRSTSYLERWADPLPLVFASFYFWNPGTSMQKSQLGLLRSLLHEVLRQQPSLIPELLSKRWHSMTAHGASTFEWTISELTAAFHVLAASTLGHKFCFLIDGLDEFDDTHKTLVEFLFRLTRSTNIKVVASSRPWLVFRDGFWGCPQLAVQDLTHEDIREFAQDSLHNHPRFSSLLASEPDRAPKLVAEISARASGVFLWVFLVVRSLMEGITNADRMSDLHKRLEQLPSDLEQYFLYILTSLDPFYQLQASRLFRLALEARSPLSLLTYSFLDEEDPGYALSRPIAPMLDDEYTQRCDDMERRLNSRCKGLLECRRTQVQTAYVDGDNVNTGRVAYEVDFLHRTVRDFLSTPTVQVRLVALDTPQFNASMALAEAFITQIKTLPYSTHAVNYEALWNHILEALHYLSKVKEGITAEAQTALLEEMDSAAAEFRKKGIFKRRSGMNSHWVNTGYRMDFQPSSHNDLLTLAIQFNLLPIVNQLLLRQHSLNRTGKPLLAFALTQPPAALNTVFESSYRGSSIVYTVPQVEMVQLLLHHGADPNEMDEGETIWVRYLRSIYNLAAFSTSTFASQKDKWFQITSLMVKHGAQSTTLRLPRPTRQMSEQLKLPGDQITWDGRLQGSRVSVQNIIRTLFGGDSGYYIEELDELLEGPGPQKTSTISTGRRRASDSHSPNTTCLATSSRDTTSLKASSPNTKSLNTIPSNAISHPRSASYPFPNSSFSYPLATPYEDGSSGLSCSPPSAAAPFSSRFSRFSNFLPIRFRPGSHA